MNNPTVLITGVSGFTGQYLARNLLQAGYWVTGLLHSEVKRDDLGRGIYCDLLDYPRLLRLIGLIKPTYVVHLAGVAFAAHHDTRALYQVNVEGTKNLLSAIDAFAHRPARIILVSSGMVYGDVLTERIDETATPSPVGDYAKSKWMMEQLAREQFSHLPISTVRPFNYTGVGQSLNFLIPKIVEHFRCRAPTIELGNLDIIRDFSDVRTVIESYRLLLEAKVPNQIFNVCSGVGYALKDIICFLQELTGHTLSIKVNDAFVRKDEVRCRIGNPEKFNNLVYPMAHTPLKETLQWMLSHGAVVTL